jgi:hypothetical protein
MLERPPSRRAKGLDTIQTPAGADLPKLGGISAKAAPKSGRGSARARRRAQHAAAMRRHRARERDGVVVVTLALTPDETAKLARLRYLEDHELEDRRAIAAAIRALIAGILEA